MCLVTLASSACPSGSTPSRTAGFLGTSSPGPMADLYAAANQDSGVSSYISAASPAPSTGFGHGLGVGLPPRSLSHTHARRADVTLVPCQGPLIATAFTNGYHWEDSGQAWWERVSSADEPIKMLGACWWRDVIGCPQAPRGYPGSLALHPPTEYLFLKKNKQNSWTLFCCTNLTSSSLCFCPQVVWKFSCHLCYPYFHLKPRKRKKNTKKKQPQKNKNKKKNPPGETVVLLDGNTADCLVFLKWFFYSNAIHQLTMKAWKAVTGVSGANGRHVWKPFLTKEEQIQQSFFFLCLLFWGFFCLFVFFFLQTSQASRKQKKNLKCIFW